MKILQIFYLKWIKLACPHFCMLCQFKDSCLNDLNALIKELKNFKGLE